MPQCLTPFTLKKRNKFTGEWDVVPCGKCPVCVKKYASSWSFRLMQEDRICDSAYFITLTYSDDNLISRCLSPLGLMTLRKDDFQKFMKRLRKRHSKHTGVKPIRYYAVGEYGSQRLRPHFHAIVFNAWQEDIEASWMLGYVHYGTVTGASIGYTLKYMCKKSKPVGIAPGDDREPEFGLMSKKLGISYLDSVNRDYHLDDVYNRMFLTVEGGKKVTMPRYYKDKLFSDENFPSIEDARSVRAGVAHITLKKQREDHLNMLLQYDGDYYHEQSQSDLAKFRAMDRDATKNDKL